MVPGKSIVEHNEVIGMDSALRYLNSSLLNLNEITLDVSLAQKLYQTILGYFGNSSKSLGKRESNRRGQNKVYPSLRWSIHTSRTRICERTNGGTD